MTEVNGDGTVVKHHFVAYQLDEVNTYFQERYQQHEQLQLQSIQFNGWNGAIGTIEFGPVAFTREADDLGTSHSRFSGTGKGTYFCDQRAFIVLSLVTQTP